MNNQPQIEEIKKALDPAKSTFVLLPHNPSLDATAAALALFLSLKESGKDVFIGCTSKMRVEFSTLVGIDRISEKIGNRNLIVSFDYAEDAIEKVSYNVQEEKFNLVIEPKSGHPPLDSKGVKFSYEGVEAQLIFIIGAKKLEDLGALYEKERHAFSEATVINIDRATGNTNFGQINVINQGAASMSEIVFQVIKKLNLPLNVDITGNLLKGIEAQTQNLQAPFAGPDTFETVARLMRAGAKRSPTPQPQERRWPSRAPGTPIPRPQMSPQRGPMPVQERPTAPPPQPPALTQLQEPELKMQPLQKGQEPMGQTPVVQPAEQRGYQPRQQLAPPPDQGRQQRKEKPIRKKSQQSQQQQDDWNRPKIYTGSTKK